MTLEKALCTSEGLGSLNFTPPSQTAAVTPSRPLSNPTGLLPPSLLSHIPSQSNPATPNPPRRNVNQSLPQRSSSSHQRSRSLGSHDLATQALEMASTTRDQVGLDLPSPHSLTTIPTTTQCGEGATAATSTTSPTQQPGAEAATRSMLVTITSDIDPTSPREGEHFPQFEPDEPVVNDLPMATPIISPPLLPVHDDKHLPASPSSSPSTKPRQGRKPGRRQSSQRSKGPAGFASADDLMHRLFVAISGVADQLQTNHARDLRVILKHVFTVCQSESEDEPVVMAEQEKIDREETGQVFMVQSSPTLLSNTDGKNHSYSKHT